MRYIEFTIWIMVDARLWEGVGYFHLPRSVQEAEQLANLITRSVADWLSKRSGAKVESSEIYCGPFTVEDDATIDRIEAFIAEFSSSKETVIRWGLVQGRKGSGRAFHGS